MHYKTKSLEMSGLRTALADPLNIRLCTSGKEKRDGAVEKTESGVILWSMNCAGFSALMIRVTRDREGDLSVHFCLSV